MKTICLVENLKTAVWGVEKASGKNLTLPILSTLLFIVSGKEIKIRATNLSLGIEAIIPTNTEKEGVFAISANTISAFVGTLKDNEKITIELVGGTVIFTTKNTKTSIKTIPYEDFPNIPKTEGVDFSISNKILIEGIKSVFYSSAISDIKPEISSVYLYQHEDNLVFVSTDSFRLAEKTIRVKNIYNFEPIIIPFKNIIEIIKILDISQGDTNIICSKNQIIIKTGIFSITSRIIDGIYPDYKQIIPTTSTTEGIFLKQDILNTIKANSIFADKFNQITLTIDPKNKQCFFLAQNPDKGENKIMVEGALSGEKVEININQKYLADCLQSIQTDSISVSCNGVQKPIVIKGIGDKTFCYLIMPMNR